LALYSFYIHSELDYRSPEDFSGRIGSVSGGEEKYDKQISFGEAVQEGDT